ncbi:MAG: hypothetical protein US33_C0046G0003 [Parcubacteria group bacterium GW2011_GWC1_36_9]|nr:MAG: hypothetical protein US33_C0046G0003 [Parcubacteria group bacterium GW2011_GWC1_36_9]
MQVIFFNKKAEKFLQSLKEPLGTRADQSLHLLKEYGNNLRMPYSKPLNELYTEIVKTALAII